MRVYDPKRREYVRKRALTKKCDFCDRSIIREQNCPSLESQHWYALVAKYPYLDGNILIVSKRHVESLEKLDADEWSDLGQTIVKVQKRLGVLFKTHSFNVGMNEGPHSGASLSHLHIQVLPRQKNQRFTVMNLLADIHLLSLSGRDLRRLIEGKRG